MTLIGLTAAVCMSLKKDQQQPVAAPLGNVMLQLKHLHTYVTWLLLQAHFTAASNERRKLMSASLSSELRQKHNVSGSSAAVQGWYPYVVVIRAPAAFSKPRASEKCSHGTGDSESCAADTTHQTVDSSSTDQRNLVSSSTASTTSTSLQCHREHTALLSLALGVCCMLSSGF